MKHHLFIFLGILRQALAYMLVPAFFYVLLLFINSLLYKRTPSEIQGNSIADIFTLISVILMFGLYKREKIKELFQARLEFKKILALIPISILARLPIVVVIVAGILMFGDTVMDTLDAGIEFQWDIFAGARGFDAVLVFVSFAVIGPIHEELFFRGVLFPSLKKKYSVRTSMIYVTIIFTLFHVHPGLYPSSFILGLFLVWVTQKWNNLGYSIILHMLINMHPFLLQLMNL